MKKDMMESLKGKVLRVDRGGPESRIGKLLDVSEDFFTLLTEDDGVIFYRSNHIKSLTENTKNGLQFDLEIPEGFAYKTNTNFHSLLSDMKYNWVRINRGGPEKLEGVLHEANEDFVTLVVNEEVIRLSTYHIRNISYGLVIEKPEEKKEEQSNDKSEKNNNKDSKDKNGSKDKKQK